MNKIIYTDALAVPANEQLENWAQENTVVLVLPLAESANKSQLLERLGREMPDYYIFDGREVPENQIGTDPLYPKPGTKVIVQKTVAESEVLAISDSLLTAARLFRSIATDLMNRLAERLGVPIEAFANPLFRVEHARKGGQPMGRLENGWRVWFHGYECKFMHEKTRQELDVRLGYLNEFGVLDAHFFRRFIETTDGFADVKAVLKPESTAYSRALTILEKHSYLKRVYPGPSGHPASGLSATEE